MQTLLTEAEIRQRVAELAAQINEEHGQQPLTIIGVLTGSVILLADLVRQLNMPQRIGLIQASSYRGAVTRGGPVNVSIDLMPDIRGHRVLIVDDIFDTGHTLATLIQQVDDLGPIAIRSLVLLKKQGRAEVVMRPDFVGFEIPDVFVVGYGMDYDDAYRNLPYLAALDQAELGSHERPRGDCRARLPSEEHGG